MKATGLLSNYGPRARIWHDNKEGGEFETRGTEEREGNAEVNVYMRA